jgi:hypothetical protein
MHVISLPTRSATLRALTTAALLLATAVPAAAQRRSDVDFTWNGRIADGRWLLIKNVNGAVRVEEGTGDRVEVTATKRWRRGDPQDVRIDVQKVGRGEGDVLICALWYENSSCDEDGYHGNNRSGWRRNNDVSVEFVVHLPRGVKLDASTVNGDVTVRGAGSEVEAHTVNGDVEAWSTGGPVRAHTTNGSITARMRDVGSRDELEYSTVNGSVTLELPSSLGAEVDLSTVNGSVRSDFPLQVTGKISSRHIRATIGDGSRRLRARTVNGSIELKRRA